MTRALTWVNFVWQQALVRYVRQLHLKLFSARVSRLILGLSLAIGAGGTYTSMAYADVATAVGVGAVGGLGISAAACVAMGPACMAMTLCVIIIAGIVFLILQLLFQLNIFLAWIVIQAASYNNFVNATAVTLGWQLVRDVVNMFFIVVLLIIAFSTIIGYKEFHYKQYLPKLLLMAVLINFSRTLVGVLIDFSQVVTLTFVNGFKQAAAGNFAKAFGITNLLKSAVDVQSLGDVGSVLISLVFGVIVVTISTTTLTILMFYFIIRIVMLWVLLILSPIAFFATALPGKMQKAVSQVSSDWWSKLSAWLTGGPIVAFFLWLSLAVVQQGTNEFTNIASPLSKTESKNLAIASTEMGKPENIGLLIISVALMLVGVQTAVSVSSQASPALGQAAGRIKATGGPVGWFARRAGRTAGRAAAPSVAKAAGTMSQNLQKLSTRAGNLPIVGGLVAGGLLAGAGKVKGIQQGIGAAANKRVDENFKGLSTGEQLSGIDAMLASKKSFFGTGLTSDTLAALERKRAMLVTKGEGQKAIAKDAEAAVIAENAKLGITMSPEQIKAKAAVKSKEIIQGYLASAKTSGESSGDDDLVKNIDEAYKKNPGLLKGGKGLQKQIDGMEDKEITAAGMQDMMVSAALLARHNLVDSKGVLIGGEAGVLAAEPIKEFLKGGGDKANYFRAALQHFSGTGKKDLENLTTALNTDSDPGASRMQMSKSGDGKNILFSNTVAGSTEARGSMSVASLISGKRQVSSDEELVLNVASQKTAVNSAMSSLGASHSQFDAPLNTRQAAALINVASAYSGAPDPAKIEGAQREALATGLPTAIATNYDATAGTYGNIESRMSHQDNLSAAMSDIDSTDPAVRSSAINVFANTNADLITQGGQMCDVLVTAMKGNATKVKRMVEEATTEQGEKLRQLFGTLSKQMEAAKNRGGVFTSGEQNLSDLENELGGGKAFRSLGSGGGGKKKGKKGGKP